MEQKIRNAVARSQRLLWIMLTHVTDARSFPSYVVDIRPGEDELPFRIHAGNRISSPHDAKACLALRLAE